MDSNHRLQERRALSCSSDSAKHWLHQIRIKQRTIDQARLAALLGDAGAASLFQKASELPRKRSRRGRTKKARAKLRRARSFQTWLLGFRSFDAESQGRARLAMASVLLPYFDQLRRATLEARALLRRSGQLFLEPTAKNKRHLSDADSRFYWALRGHRWTPSRLRPVSNKFRAALQLCCQDPSISYLRCARVIWAALEAELINSRSMKNGLTPNTRLMIEIRIKKALERELLPWLQGRGDPLQHWVENGR